MVVLAMAGVLPVLLHGCGTQYLEPARAGHGLQKELSNGNINVGVDPEERGTCASIDSTIADHLKKIEALKRREEEERREPPSTVALVYERLFGPVGAGIAATKDLRQERARVDRLQAAFTAKGCSRE